MLAKIVERRERVHREHRFEVFDRRVLVGGAHSVRGYPVHDARHPREAVESRIGEARTRVDDDFLPSHLEGDRADGANDVVVRIRPVRLGRGDKPPVDVRSFFERPAEPCLDIRDGAPGWAVTDNRRLTE